MCIGYQQLYNNPKTSWCKKTSIISQFFLDWNLNAAWLDTSGSESLPGCHQGGSIRAAALSSLKAHSAALDFSFLPRWHLPRAAHNRAANFGRAVKKEKPERED